MITKIAHTVVYENIFITTFLARGRSCLLNVSHAGSLKID